MSARPFGLCAGEFPAPQDAADAMTREAQERGEYDTEINNMVLLVGRITFGPPTPHRECDRTVDIRVSPAIKDHLTTEPLSSIPGLIEQIRKERDEAQEALRARDACRRVDFRFTDGELRAALRNVQPGTRDESLIHVAACAALDFRACAEKAEKERNALKDRYRVRDARVEPPPVLEEILCWTDPYWTPGWLRMDGVVAFCDLDFEAMPLEKAPYWLPMPLPPEEKQ